MTNLSKMRQILYSILLFFLFHCGLSQVAPNKYFIEFKDKKGTPYSLDKPEEFLSQRAIERRIAQSIMLSENDLPVNPSYVQQVLNKGVSLLTQSKWFNGITIYAPDTTVLPAINALPFVRKIIKNAPVIKNEKEPVDKFLFENSYVVPIGLNSFKSIVSAPTYDYGPSYAQIHMVNGDGMHNMGYRGEGKVIAVLDGGFLYADVVPFFDSLRANGQILGTRDFVEPGKNVYTTPNGQHGTEVLSIMGGNMPGQIIGTAPKAKYWLFRSEEIGLPGNPVENIVEEYNWVSAAELADSVGADIINSSLGYTTFDDSRVNHTWADLDGNSTPVTRGANIAASKGIAVVNSAGNYGNMPWRHIGAPADGNEVLAVAAVDSLGFYAYFSSVGVVNGSRVKPNIAAMGLLTVIGLPDGTTGRGYGTSFSSPIIAGMAASLWQAEPGVSNFRIYDAIQESASQFGHPDSLLGYGIPNFVKAMEILSVHKIKKGATTVYPNPFSGFFTVKLISEKNQKVSMGLYDGVGKAVRQQEFDCLPGENKVHFTSLSGLPPGIYFLKLYSQSLIEYQQIIKIGNN